jgi:hypothetical protein
MPEVIHVRGEGGGVWPMDLPLSPPIQQRFDRGELVRVNEDGSAWTEQPDAPKPRRGRPPKPAADE